MMAERWQMQVMANKHDSERQIGFYDGQSDRLMDICDSRVAFVTENGLKHKSSLRLLADIYHIRPLGLNSFDTLMLVYFISFIQKMSIRHHAYLSLVT